MPPRRTRRSTTTREPVQLGAGSVSGRDFRALRATESAETREAVSGDPIADSGRSQTIVVQGFPSPPVARALSPNGRAHWAQRQSCRQIVAANVSAAIVMQRTRPVSGPVRLTFRYVFPERRRRDVDNLTTGVTKAAIDTLVRLGVLAADDSKHVLSVTVEPVVERRARRLEIVIEPAPSDGQEV